MEGEAQGLPVLAVEGAGTSVPSSAPRQPSPYAAVIEAARNSSAPPPPEVSSDRASAEEAIDEEESAAAVVSAVHIPPAPAPMKTIALPEPNTDEAEGRISASPIVGIEEGLATAASGKQGISVYPPAPAPAPSGPPVTAAGSPGATMRFGSVSSSVAAGGDASHSGRHITQTFGTPAMSASAASSFGWTPPPAFGSHPMPHRESDAPPGWGSIPPAPKNPSHLDATAAPAHRAPRALHSPVAQTLPLTPARSVAAIHEPGAVVEAPSAALALVRGRGQRARSEPPAASSIICDVPKGWAPHPTLLDNEVTQELAALRDQLYRLAARECFVVGVSSGPEMAAYKSGVAGRLAWVLAQPGEARVLLMEGDFDHPVVHRLMRIDMPIASGFSEQMRRRMNGSPPGPWTIVRCAPNLYVLAEGIVRSPGLMPTVQFADSVNELRRSYDLIVIDGPAGGMSVDTRALDSVADGIVLAGDADLLDRAATWFGKKQLMAVVSVGVEPPLSR